MTLLRIYVSIEILKCMTTKFNNLFLVEESRANEWLKELSLSLNEWSSLESSLVLCLSEPSKPEPGHYKYETSQLQAQTDP